MLFQGFGRALANRRVSPTSVLDSSFNNVHLCVMARPREFDETRALKGAMFLFWQRGFAATSIAELEEATGLKRQSLYNAFGDKKELYVRSLELYREQTYAALAPLREESAGVSAVVDVIRGLLDLQKKVECAGCMVVKAAFDLQVKDEEIVESVRRASACMRTHFARCLQRSIDRGELQQAADPKALANYLFTLVNGLNALAQTGADRNEVEASLELGFAGLPWCERARAKAAHSRSARGPL